MLCREIFAVCSEIHAKHTNTPCWQNVAFLCVKPGGIYSYHWKATGGKSRYTQNMGNISTYGCGHRVPLFPLSA